MPCKQALRYQTFAPLISILILSVVMCAKVYAKASDTETVIMGAERLHVYLPLLHKQRVGLVVNQTSVTRHGHLLDLLLANDVDVKVLFAPEHGVRGEAGAGEHIQSGVDSKTGVVIQSIYGANKTPPDSVMEKLDVIIFDIQDVGTRFYTYISSMHYMMQASAKHNVHFIVLDRPNPNGAFVDGPVLDLQFQSFVGMHPIPVLHGLTVGELARIIKGEKWIEDAEKLKLDVITMQGYRKDLLYSLPIAPSPNLPNDQAIQLYPSLCFFEGTAVSVGRGTDAPFQQIGHHKVSLGPHTFTPVSRPQTAPKPKLEGEQVFGLDLQTDKTQGLSLEFIINAYKEFAQEDETFFTAPDFFDKLAGTDALRLAIENAKSEAEIRLTWQRELNEYKAMRSAYLLYPLHKY
uniref:exo-beta-N-acetylmuramidase NamZ family protein n=1 Tax=Ningiella ruwaisensis TaxID=2364274 RepID=UPI00109EEDA0|nr:DUF1343 domain-containing protein [Ningiella ruwaisensis]